MGRAKGKVQAQSGQPRGGSGAESPDSSAGDIEGRESGQVEEVQDKRVLIDDVKSSSSERGAIGYPKQTRLAGRGSAPSTKLL